MDVLPWHFKTFRVLGLYYEDTKRFRPLKLIHKMIAVTLTFHFALFLTINLLLMSGQGIEAFTACIFLSLTYVASSFKQINFVLDRARIDKFIDKFRLHMCKPQDDDERTVLAKYEYFAKRVMVVRMITTGASGAAFLVTALISIHSNNLELPFNAYNIFNISNLTSYIIAYIAQLITTINGISSDVTLDAVACGFIILICGQLDLLAKRIVTSSNKTDSDVFLKYCVEHHTLIFFMVQELQSCFMTVMIPSFLSALITLCSSIFQLAKQNNTLVDYIGFILFANCLVVQLYYYCWFGNELQLKNETVTNAIFQSEWLSIKPHQRKNYWLMMFMGQKELVISYHGQCMMNVQTFIWMLKTTYTAFNLLQQVSD